jgi:glycine cleavage system regulatory protein
MGDPIPAWQCIGCGRIEAPQTCIGVCQDRKVFLVSLQDYQEALDQVQRMIGEIDAMQSLITRLAHTSPHESQFETSWCAVQADARSLLAGLS